MEAHIDDRRLVDTGDITGVDSLFKAGVEAAAVYGSMSLQAEYVRTSLARSNLTNPEFDGYYVYGSWFLSGESRAAAYRQDSGTFARIHPLAPLGSGAGAWELAARFSHLDLTDSNVFGGSEDNLTLGLNWYPNAHVRFMFNYINVLDVSGGPNDGDEPDTFQVRAQVDF